MRRAGMYTACISCELSVEKMAYPSKFVWWHRWSCPVLNNIVYLLYPLANFSFQH